MDGASSTDGGDGDSAAKEAAKNFLVPDLPDEEHLHADNAKRSRMNEDAQDVQLDEIGIAIDSEENESKPGEKYNSGVCEASTSSGNNLMTNSVAEEKSSEGNPLTEDDTNNQNIPMSRDLINSDADADTHSSADSSASEMNELEEVLLTAARAMHSSNLNENEDADGYFDSAMRGIDRLTDSDTDEEEDNKPAVLLKAKPKHNWFIIPEIQSRQFGTSANRQSSAQFQQRCYGSLHCVERLELMYKLDKHTGCVNSINFHPNGTLLASGSDDLEIVIWDWKMGNPLMSYESKHRSNVFQSKFMPLSGDDLHIVSCARDGQVRLAQISAKEGFRSTRKLGSHRGPSHKLTVLYDQPQVVISVGEDGLVLKHDLRCTKSDKVLTVHRDDMDVVALYSISSNPLNSNEFCVAGRDYQTRTFDLRKANKELAFYHPFDKVGDIQKHLHVTCAVYNHNGSEVLASYNDEDIYLFDTKAKEGDYVHFYQGHRNRATIKGVNFFGPKSEFIISGSDCGYVYFWEKSSEAIVQFLRADDNGVVNCLEPHPQLPFLCTSGLDRDIKVWVPSYEEDPKMTDLVDTVKQNLKERSHWSSASSSEVENARILWMLWRQFNTTELLQRIVSTADDDLSNHSSSSDSNSSSSDFTSSASEHDSENYDGPGGCSPS